MTITRTIGYITLLVLCFTDSLNADTASEELAALQATLPGELMHNPYDIQWKINGEGKSAKMVDAPQIPSGQAVQIRVRKKPDNPWDISAGIPIAEPVQKGQTLQVYYWMRTAKPATDRDTALVDVVLGRNEEPWDSIINKEVQPSSEWQLLSSTGVAQANFRDNNLNMGFNLGKAKQTVQIGSFYVVNLGFVD